MRTGYQSILLLDASGSMREDFSTVFKNFDSIGKRTKAATVSQIAYDYVNQLASPVNVEKYGENAFVTIASFNSNNPFKILADLESVKLSEIHKKVSSINQFSLDDGSNSATPFTAALEKAFENAKKWQESVDYIDKRTTIAFLTDGYPEPKESDGQTIALQIAHYNNERLARGSQLIRILTIGYYGDNSSMKDFGSSVLKSLAGKDSYYLDSVDSETIVKKIFSSTFDGGRFSVSSEVKSLP
jgi:hypothetical protein